MLRLGLSQFNATVGDIDDNLDKMLAQVDAARNAGVDLLIFPELAVTGYPPEDLLLKPDFIHAATVAVHTLAARSGGLTVVVGSPFAAGDYLHNSALVLHDGQLHARYDKQLLPNYGVFDERRYFAAGCSHLVCVHPSGFRFAVNVCEDIWPAQGPIVEQAASADLVVNISASPYDMGKGDRRHVMLSERARDHHVAIAYCNLVGGQDELVFDGQSVVFGRDGELMARAPQFREHLLIVDVGAERRPDAGRPPSQELVEVALPPLTTRREARKSRPPAVIIAPSLEPLDEVYAALVLATRDYVSKSGFRQVLIGLSGGIDSALTAVIASDALGPENVLTVGMPTRYSSGGSVDDSRELARNVGFQFHVIPIDGLFEHFLTSLAPHFAGMPSGLAEENVQPRVRGTLLMALSNKLGALVLTTGNKSEIAVGYCTLYGDTAGGYAVLKDVPKTLVYALTRHRNAKAGGALIPQAIIDKPPSAELRPDQKDTDSLPPYDVLDRILEAYVVENRSIEQIVDLGFDEATVCRVIKLVDRNEYKRRQSAPGVRISQRAFGKDWRLPIAQRYAQSAARTPSAVGSPDLKGAT